MASFFYGELSPDLFMMNLNPFSGQTTTTNVHNNHFRLQQHRPRVGELEEVSHIEQGDFPISTFSNGGVFRDLAPAYLRAAQELLNEIVNVGNRSRSAKQERQMSKEYAVYGVGDIYSGHKLGVSACRQELQMKKAKLISMVEKVEQKYKQYHDQMQTIILSFEQAAGLGSANSYTQMALQTISKQFRAVKDLICLQIKHINKLLGERESNEQLGKMSHYHSNAWRPQRGLPEKAVSILRAWLFEHFLHPYPRDLDKEMLAKQTGLTKNQVSNWFINARVRVWKPMVEELYLEEMEIEERDGNKPNDSNKASSKKPYYNTTLDESSNSILSAFHQEFIENEISTNNSSSSFSVARFTNQHVNQANLIHSNGGFENYHAIVRNGVSLSLGLPHSCDQSFTNIQFGSTSHGTEISGIYTSSTFQIMD